MSMSASAGGPSVSAGMARELTPHASVLISTVRELTYALLQKRPLPSSVCPPFVRAARTSFIRVASEAQATGRPEHSWRRDSEHSEQR